MAGLFGSKGAADSARAGVTAAAPDRQKLLLVAVAGLAFVAAFVLLVLPMLTGGGDDASAGPVAGTHRRPPAAIPTPSPAPSETFAIAPAAYGDPFAPLPEESAAAAAASAVAPAAPTVPSAGAPSTTAAGTAGTAAAGTGTTAGSTATGSSTADNTPAAGKPVEVIAITGTEASIKIDSKSYAVQAGQSPATGYTVVSIANNKITISHGGTSHILSVGELQTF